MEIEISPSSSCGFLSTRLLEEIWFPSCFGAGPVCGRSEDGVNVSLCLLTSLISFIFAPPFPMREPHWLAGITSRRVTGGLELMVPLATNAARSWKGRIWNKKEERNKTREGEKRGSHRGQGQTAQQKSLLNEQHSNWGWKSLTLIFKEIIQIWLHF